LRKSVFIKFGNLLSGTSQNFVMKLEWYNYCLVSCFRIIWNEVESRNGYTVGLFLINLWTMMKWDRNLYLHNTQNSQRTDMLPIRGIQTHHSSKRAAADPRVRPRGHWDRRMGSIFFNTANSPKWAKVSSWSRIHDNTRLDTPHSLGLLWTSDQPDTENSSWK